MLCRSVTLCPSSCRERVAHRVGPVSGFPTQFFFLHLLPPLRDRDARSDMETQRHAHTETLRSGETLTETDMGNTLRDIYGDAHKQVELDSHKLAIKEREIYMDKTTYRHL